MIQKTHNQKPNATNTDSRQKLISIVGGASGLLVAAIFLISLITLIGSDSQTNATPQDNFLILLFKLHAGISGNHMESLTGLNILDVTILILLGIMSLALFPTTKQVNRVWAIIAVCLPFIGLGMYVLTKDIGRSGILGAGLIMAMLLLSSDAFPKRTAFVGLLANTFLLLGDIGTAFSYSIVLAIFIGFGYMLSILWSALVGRELIQRGLQKS